MSFSAYVDSYPITAYIVGHLGLSVSDFCRRYEFDPRSSAAGRQRIVPFSPCLLTLWNAWLLRPTKQRIKSAAFTLVRKQHFAYLAASPA